MSIKTIHCQLTNIATASNPVSGFHKLFQRRNRLKRIVKRRIEYLRNVYTSFRNAEKTSIQNYSAQGAVVTIKPGDLVKIRNREEIKSTLNHWNQLKGCAFMEEMWPYCGSIFRVFKEVKQFLDERDYVVKKCKGIFLLEGVICNGTKDFGHCDRACFYFWRKEWLEKLPDEK